MSRAVWIPLVILVSLAGPRALEGDDDPDPAPRRVDLRPEFERLQLPWKGQGRRNTCSVFTTVGAMEFAVSKKRGKPSPLSEEYLNWACNQVIGNTTQDRGQFFHHLLKGYEKHGICLEAEMPYARRFHPEYEPSERARRTAAQIRDLGLAAHWIKPNDGTKGIDEAQLEAIKEALRRGWPVCGGSHHSILLVGFEDDADQPGGGRFLVRDSGNRKAKPMSFAEARKRLCDLLWYEVDLSDGK